MLEMLFNNFAIEINVDPLFEGHPCRAHESYENWALCSGGEIRRFENHCQRQRDGTDKPGGFEIGKMPDACLNEHWFDSLREAKEIIED